jgi:hypothetical protein
LDLFRQHETDVFFHFWDTVDDAEKQQIVARYQPKAYSFEPQLDFTADGEQFTRRDNINSPPRLLSMYCGWRRVAAVFEWYRQQTNQHYDFAVRLRADLMFFGQLDGYIPALGPRDLVVSGYNDFGIVNDTFAFGGVDAILYYHSLFDRLTQYHHRDQVLFNPEHLLAHHLNSNNLGLRVFKEQIVMLVFRPHMVGMPIEECLKEHPGASKWLDPEVVAAHKEFHVRKHGQAGEVLVEVFKAQQLQFIEQVKRGQSPRP